MKELVYVSKAIPPFKAADVEHLLHEARDFNGRHDITGVLFFNGTHFLQYLEGPKAAVDGLFANIEKDRRHEDVMVFYEGEAATRSFPDWSMGYKVSDAEGGLAEWNRLQTLIQAKRPGASMGLRLAALLNGSFIAA